MNVWHSGDEGTQEERERKVGKNLIACEWDNPDMLGMGTLLF